MTAFNCDCKGFVSHQRCMHNSALLVAVGFVDTDPTPEPEPIRVHGGHCEECAGVGSVPGTISTGPTSWAYANVTCDQCHGTGETASVPVAA